MSTPPKNARTQPAGFAGQNAPETSPPGSRQTGTSRTRSQSRPETERANGGLRPVQNGQILGYARISRGDSQQLDRQRDELTAAGATRIFTDELSGGRAAESRPGFAQLLAHCREGDVITVVSLDRLGRSLSDLMMVVEDLVERRGVTVRVLNLGDLDTRNPMSKLLLAVLGAVAELERSLIRERTISGLAAAKRRGAQLGRKPSLSADQIAGVKAMRAAGATAADASRAFGVSERTIRRATSE